MSKNRLAFLAAMFLILLAPPLLGVTYRVPEDRELVLRSELVVVAGALSSHARFNRFGGIITVADLRVEEVLKGHVEEGALLAVESPGGAVGTMATLVPGAPRFESGRRYLVFLMPSHTGGWTTYGLGLGHFETMRDHAGREYVVRGSGEGLFGWSEARPGEAYVERYRSAAGFLRFIRAVAANPLAPALEDYFAHPSEQAGAALAAAGLRPETNQGRLDFLFEGNFRAQNGGQANIVHCCAPDFQPGFNGPNALASANNAWNGTGTSISYNSGPADPAAQGGIPGLGRGSADGRSAVLFNDPFNDFAASGVPPGVVGIGGISSTAGQYQLPDGITYNNTAEVDVVIAKNINTDSATFVGILTHELGHTLGFRHSNGQRSISSPPPGCSAPLPCSSDAIMNSVVSGSGLRQWDRDAAQTVYGSGPVCTPPAVQSISANPFSINAGQTSTLSVTATGTAPQTFQWFIGTPPNTSQPIPGATGTSVQVQPTTTTSYFVRITGCSQTINSQAVQVQVQSACPTVSVTATSMSNAGGGFTLTANATGGSGFSFQWFVGSSSGPSAGSGQSITVNPSSTTTYVVRATNSCNNSGEGSVTVVVTGGCPQVVTSMPVVTALGGGQFRLSAGASGGSDFQFSWFQGMPPSGNFISGGQMITVQPNTSTSYFFVATNSCGNSGTSVAVVVTPSQTCNPPQIASVTANPTSINSGQTSTLSVNASGTSLAFQWYIGMPGDFSRPIAGANAASVQVMPSATTTYFVQVASGCGAGSINSAPLTVTVTTGNQCVPPSITAQPSSTSVPFPLTATLSVTAAGTGPLAYQWFIGQPGDTSSPVAGATASTLVVRPETTTAYWVRVTGQCGSPVISSGATVTVTVVRRRSVRG